MKKSVKNAKSLKVTHYCAICKYQRQRFVHIAMLPTYNCCMSALARIGNSLMHRDRMSESWRSVVIPLYKGKLMQKNAQITGV